MAYFLSAQLDLVVYYHLPAKHSLFGDIQSRSVQVEGGSCTGAARCAGLGADLPGEGNASPSWGADAWICWLCTMFLLGPSSAGACFLMGLFCLLVSKPQA